MPDRRWLGVVDGLALHRKQTSALLTGGFDWGVLVIIISTSSMILFMVLPS